MKVQSLRRLYLQEIYNAVINAANGFTEYILRNTFEDIDKPEPLKDDLIGNMKSLREIALRRKCGCHLYLLPQTKGLLQ